jgi:very-short-patch-repair endonuclease
VSKLPKALSPGECEFENNCRAYNLKPEREYFFHLTRKWRFDFAWPDEKLAVEIEGVSKFIFGRHQQKDGYTKDTEKYNAAVVLEWRVLRFTTEAVFSGEAIDTVRAILKPQKSPHETGK